MIPPNFSPVALSESRVPNPKQESISAQSEAPRDTRAYASPRARPVSREIAAAASVRSKMVKKFRGCRSGRFRRRVAPLDPRSHRVEELGIRVHPIKASVVPQDSILMSARKEEQQADEC